jgi:sn-glycerol 3-phosphate transport system substrate-binding protein
MLGPGAVRAQQRVPVEFWHGLTQPLGGILEQIVADFNASQSKYQVNPTFKGQYPETMVAAVAAFRAGNAPHIVQMFEVGTATMMAAGPAIKPVYELAKETGVNLDPKNYVGGVRGYYSTTDGKLVSMPFNSSTTVTWYNKDAFKKAGLDPEKPPRTWEETWAAARKIVQSKAASCGYSMAWPTWTQFENFSAIHNVPLATRANGMDGMNAELKINSPLHVKHTQNMMEAQKEGAFKYGGRDGAADALFPSGECAILHGSSGLRARVMREAKFAWGGNLPAVLQGDAGRTEELHHWRRQFLGDDLAQAHRR